MNASALPQSQVVLRPMTAENVGPADQLRQLAGWNQIAEDWRTLLALEPGGCFVALKHRELVGTVTTICYGTAIAWIGMMLVHPQHRRQGIATRLMRRALEYLQSRAVSCIRLDATPAGYPLYQALGFVPEWTLTRWQRPLPGEIGWGEAGPGRVAEPSSLTAKVRKIEESDWPAIIDLDTRAWRIPRPALLRRLAQTSLAALVWPLEAPLRGWGLLRPGANADYLGPLVCWPQEGFLPLANALLQSAGSRAVFWDVPDGNALAKAAVQQLGFSPVRPLTRMRFGPNSVTTDPNAQFAIADPAVG